MGKFDFFEQPQAAQDSNAESLEFETGFVSIYILHKFNVKSLLLGQTAYISMNYTDQEHRML